MVVESTAAGRWLPSSSAGMVLLLLLLRTLGGGHSRPADCSLARPRDRPKLPERVESLDDADDADVGRKGGEREIN